VSGRPKLAALSRCERDGGIAALHELALAAARIGVLINPASNSAASGWNQAQTAARILGV
jgi:hypothetical protein